MRVATRRLRAALEIFEPCFPPKELGAALGQVKAIADALGERRDRDVAIAALEEFAGAMPAPDRPGRRDPDRAAAAEQAEANEALAPFVDAGQLAALSELLSELVADRRGSSRRRAGVKARRVKKLDPRAPLADNAARIIRVRLDEMRSFAPAALESERIRDQHDMRIAAKRLRYVLETTEFCFGKPAQTARRRARDLQDLLGELHDCDVMLPRVEGHLADAARRGRGSRAGARGRRRRPRPRAGRPRPASHRLPRPRGPRGLPPGAPQAALRPVPRVLGGAGARRHLGPAGARRLGRRLRGGAERRTAAKRAEQARRELEAAERAGARGRRRAPQRGGRGVPQAARRVQLARRRSPVAAAQQRQCSARRTPVGGVEAHG